jgi:hypothetical protein
MRQASRCDAHFAAESLKERRAGEGCLFRQLHRDRRKRHVGCDVEVATSAFRVHREQGGDREAYAGLVLVIAGWAQSSAVSAAGCGRSGVACGERPFEPGAHCCRR